jgi:hypothetical protein
MNGGQVGEISFDGFCSTSLLTNSSAVLFRWRL